VDENEEVKLSTAGHKQNASPAAEYIPWNRQCRVCGRRLAFGERKYHAGACAKRGKVLAQKARRAWNRQRPRVPETPSY